MLSALTFNVVPTMVEVAMVSTALVSSPFYSYMFWFYETTAWYWYCSGTTV